MASGAVESTLKEVERVAKKQKTCAAKTGDALSKLIKASLGGGPGASILCGRVVQFAGQLRLEVACAGAREGQG